MPLFAREKDKDNARMNESKKCQENNRNKQEQGRYLKGVSQGIIIISNSRNDDHMKDKVKLDMNIDFVEAQEEDMHGLDVNFTCANLKCKNDIHMIVTEGQYTTLQGQVKRDGNEGRDIWSEEKVKEVGDSKGWKVVTSMWASLLEYKKLNFSKWSEHEQNRRRSL